MKIEKKPRNMTILKTVKEVHLHRKYQKTFWRLNDDPHS